MTPTPTSPIDQPRDPAGRYGPFVRAEDELKIEQLVADRNAFWTTGTIHPTGGYDEIMTDDLGGTYYFLDGQFHREDGPAAIHPDGTQEYYWEGALHREGDEPAIISSTGEKEWRRMGAIHRDGDLPARLAPDGAAEYWRNGVRHRGGGEPAIVNPDGYTEWWVEGQRHRTAVYGPAIIRPDGSEEYWEEGKKVSAPALPRTSTA